MYWLNYALNMLKFYIHDQSMSKPKCTFFDGMAAAFLKINEALNLESFLEELLVIPRI